MKKEILKEIAEKAEKASLEELFKHYFPYSDFVIIVTNYPHIRKFVKSIDEEDSIIYEIAKTLSYQAKDIKFDGEKLAKRYHRNMVQYSNIFIVNLILNTLISPELIPKLERMMSKYYSKNTFSKDAFRALCEIDPEFLESYLRNVDKPSLKEARRFYLLQRVDLQGLDEKWLEILYYAAKYNKEIYENVIQTAKLNITSLEEWETLTNIAKSILEADRLTIWLKRFPNEAIEYYDRLMIGYRPKNSGSCLRFHNGEIRMRILHNLSIDSLVRYFYYPNLEDPILRLTFRLVIAEQEPGILLESMYWKDNISQAELAKQAIYSVLDFAREMKLKVYTSSYTDFNSSFRYFVATGTERSKIEILAARSPSYSQTGGIIINRKIEQALRLVL
jgi:hypothetical protein